MTANLTGSLNPAVKLDATLASEANGSAWRSIEQSVEQLAALAQSDISLQDFYAPFLDIAIEALVASGGAIWRVPLKGPTASLVQVRYPDVPGIAGVRGRWASASDALGIRILPPRSPSLADSWENPFESPLLVCELRDHNLATTIIEIALAPDTTPEVQSRLVGLFNVFREVAVEFHRCQELKALRRQGAERQQFEEFVLRIHSSLEPASTAYALANDGRRLIDCDRVSVAEVINGRAAVLAVSGVDHIDRNSAQICALEKLTAAVAANRELLIWTEGKSQELPPQIDHAREVYLDLVHARRLIVLPLYPSAASADENSAIRAVLIAESYDERLPEDCFEARVADVGRHGGAALLAALSHYDLPLLPLQLRLGRLLRTVRQRKIAVLLSLGSLALTIGLLAIVPASFLVEAQGTLEPKTRRHLFAPADGVVEQVLAEHGQQVAKNDTVLQLRDPRLGLDYSRVSGELQTARARLDSVRSNRSRRSSAADVREEVRQLAAEEEQLKEQVLGLESQLQLLGELRASLRVASPIDGVVLTWNPEDLLLDRPVKQGQLLMTVADVAGIWELKLQIADADVGHVLAAQRSGKGALPVTFLLATDYAVTHRGEIERVGMATEVFDDDLLATQARARIEGPLPAEVRAGARVFARIDCGKKPIGYVWLHDLIDAIRTYVLF